MEHLNDNIDWQLFCAIYLGCKQLENLKKISEVRSNLAEKLDTDTIFKAHLLTRTRTMLAFLCAKKSKTHLNCLKRQQKRPESVTFFQYLLEKWPTPECP